MLRLVSLDYHGARMMGLGCIDEYPDHNQGVQYVYAAVYRTYRTLPQVGENNDHIFLTLPTSTFDHRLPLAPRVHEVSYGLYVSTDEESEPQLISDEQGYSLWDDTRFVNLSKTNVNEPQPVLSSIPAQDLFDATQITQPASFGIEYREHSEPYWRSPELLHDDEYAGSDGQYETITTPEKEGNPIYTHRETENGTHLYALYSVNWFSRVSDVSDAVKTDETVFPKRNRLLPPFNFAVQYIQEEDPLIFTTQAEQNALANANAANPNGDNYKTRVSFDWNNIHNNAYQSANKIEFFFREAPVKKVEGKIKWVSAVSDAESLVATTSFLMASSNPPAVVSPQMAPAEYARFIGSLLNTADGQFQIVSISPSSVPGDGPHFVVKNLVSNELVQAGPDEPMINAVTYTAPKQDEVFFVFENVSETTGWTKLNQTVNLMNFSNASEMITEEDGSTHMEIVGGINGSAQVTEIAGSGGGYRITFPSGVNLLPHADPAVSWIKGSVRLKLLQAPQFRKRLPVVAIEQTSPVQVVVFDPEYFTLPDERIQTGLNVEVNFHPSYRVYLSPQPGVFDKTKILPQGGQNNKKTYLAARSADTSQPFYSPLTPPSILVARSIQKPLAPEAINGPEFATRPDFYGKSTYTMDVRLNTTNRTPFGLVMYRANETAILQALYKPSTLQQVQQDLEQIAGNDPYRFNRWRSLVEVETDPADNNKFKLFGPYRFPNPDNDSTEVFTTATASVHPFPLAAGETLQSEKAMIKKVIEEVFSPLTETPVVFEYLKTGYQTSSAQPTTRSIIGRLLAPTDAAFNPFPMAVKFPQASPDTVRFTDYTLNGNSRNIYFYFAKEVSVNAKFSARTPVSGPVVMVDAAPAEKPKIRKVLSREAAPVLNQPAGVEFELAEYIDAENIKQFQVFRATDIADASSVRSMKLASTVNVGDPVEDNFSDLVYPPYGQPLFYRVVALREIVNEQGVTEMVPSQPSEMLLTNVIDAVNPEAPELTATEGGVVTNGNNEVVAYTNVSLSWQPTTYNATYHLYKLTSKGNWEKLWSKKSNAAQITFPENGDFVTWPQTASLNKMDADGNEVFHRFKVAVENASGLFNQHDKELVV